MPTPKVYPVRRKIPLEAPSGTWPLAQMATCQAAHFSIYLSPVSLRVLARRESGQVAGTATSALRARAIDQSRVGREAGACVVGGWVVSGLGCRGRHFAASRNASPDTSSFFSFWRLQYRFWRQRSEVSILERLSAAHCVTAYSLRRGWGSSRNGRK